MPIDWINDVMKKENIFIQHALNGDEVQIPGTKYKVDGFCKETNTIYEFMGGLFHSDPRVYRNQNETHPLKKTYTHKQIYDKTILRI